MTVQSFPRSGPIVFTTDSTTGNVPRAVKTLICKSDLYKGKIRLFVEGGLISISTYLANQPSYYSQSA